MTVVGKGERGWFPQRWTEGGQNEYLYIFTLYLVIFSLYLAQQNIIEKIMF